MGVVQQVVDMLGCEGEGDGSDRVQRVVDGLLGAVKLGEQQGGVVGSEASSVGAMEEDGVVEVEEEEDKGEVGGHVVEGKGGHQRS